MITKIVEIHKSENFTTITYEDEQQTGLIVLDKDQLTSLLNRLRNNGLLVEG